MKRSNTLLTLSALAVACTVGIAQAQTPPAAPAGGPASGAPPSETTPGTAPSEGTPWPVLFVTSIEVLRSAHTGGMDIVRARGLVTSGGWTSPHILPINRGKTIDGVLDLLFQAHAPQSAAELGPFVEVEALLPISPGHPYKAVRVRSGANAITLKTLPGFIEVKAAKEYCSKCVGKYFLAKGAAAPAGVAATDIRPDQGIPNYTLDPNRLTLVLTEDGRIAEGAWD